MQPKHRADAAQITEERRQIAEKTEIFNQFKATKLALHNKLIAAVDHTYLKELKNPMIGLGEVTCLQILCHLYANFEKSPLPTWKKT